MDWKVNKQNPRALMLHAHPDDEPIFAGRLILSNPEWRWTMVCITMQPARLITYKHAIEKYAQQGVDIESFQTLNKQDTGQELNNADKLDWLNAVKSLDLNPDIVFTHNTFGEYGHNHHRATSAIARQLYNNVWDIVYPGKQLLQRNRKNIKHIALTPDIKKLKKQIFEECYASESQGLWEQLNNLMSYEFNEGPEIFTAD